MLSKRLAVGALVGVAASALLIAPAAADSNNVIVTYAGNGQAGFSGDGGPATSAELNMPSGLVLDNAGNVFFADTNNARIRKIDPSQTITTVAGTGTQAFRDGPGATAQFHNPQGLAITSDGVLYVGDTNNEVVRKVDTAGNVTTVVGTPTKAGYSGDNGPANQAKLNDPTGVAVDGSGNLFIADKDNDVVREVIANNGVIDGTNTIVTFAGTPTKSGFSGNSGPATNAKMSEPQWVAVTGSAVLISDTGNNQVRKVSGGVITAFAGTAGGGGFAGDGGQATAAKINKPMGVSVDPLGNAYFVDKDNARIAQVDPSGVISTLIGVPTKSGFSGDGGACERAQIKAQDGVATDASNVFFSDTGNQRIRRCHKDGPPPALPEAPAYQNVLLAGTAAALLGGGGALASRRRRKSSTEPAA